jgi:hypothetical protein
MHNMTSNQDMNATADSTAAEEFEDDFMWADSLNHSGVTNNQKKLCASH